MTRKDHLKFCEICHHRSLNFRKGLICSKTNEIADFNIECDSFEKDDIEKERLFEKRLSSANDTNSGDPIDFKKNKENGILAMVIGIGILFLTLFAESIPLIIIPSGAMIWGWTVYKKGVKQEQIHAENKEN